MIKPAHIFPCRIEHSHMNQSVLCSLWIGATSSLISFNLEKRFLSGSVTILIKVIYRLETALRLCMRYIQRTGYKLDFEVRLEHGRYG